jgi:hypothetical protein
MSQVSSPGQDTVDQSGDSSTKHVCLVKKPGFRLEQTQLNRQLDLTVEFASRGHRDLQKAAHLSWRTSAAALRDVGADRNCSRSHLSSQPIPLSCGKCTCSLIDRSRQGDTFRPYIESSKVTHIPLPTESGDAIQVLVQNCGSPRPATWDSRDEIAPRCLETWDLRPATCDLGQQR